MTAGIKYSPCKRALKQWQGKRKNFEAYLQAFEYCVVEPGILSGKLGTLESLPIHNPLDETSLAEEMGIKDFWLNRIVHAKEFFSQYERYGRFSFSCDSFFNTKFYQETRDSLPNASWLILCVKLILRTLWGEVNLVLQPNYLVHGKKPFFYVRLLIRILRERKQFSLTERYYQALLAINIQPFLNMFERMKDARGLIPSSKSPRYKNRAWKPRDYPWAIDYLGYIKKRDGSHRRSILHYLGITHTPTLLVRFEDISMEYVENNAPCLVSEFDWFKHEVYARVKKHISC